MLLPPPLSVTLYVQRVGWKGPQSPARAEGCPSPASRSPQPIRGHGVGQHCRSLDAGPHLRVFRGGGGDAQIPQSLLQRLPQPRRCRHRRPSHHPHSLARQARRSAEERRGAAAVRRSPAPRCDWPRTRRTLRLRGESCHSAHAQSGSAGVRHGAGAGGRRVPQRRRGWCSVVLLGAARRSHGSRLRGETVPEFLTEPQAL